MTAGAAVTNEIASSTVPSVLRARNEAGYGLGGAEGEVSLIANNIEALTADSSGNVTVPKDLAITGDTTFTGATAFTGNSTTTGFRLESVTAGITADTGSSQGDGPLTTEINQISVCANAGDAVTLPTAIPGMSVTIINDGANACDVFPATGADLGAGADTAASLAAGASINYKSYALLNWQAIS